MKSFCVVVCVVCLLVVGTSLGFGAPPKANVVINEDALPSYTVDPCAPACVPAVCEPACSVPDGVCQNGVCKRNGRAVRQIAIPPKGVVTENVNRRPVIGVPVRILKNVRERIQDRRQGRQTRRGGCC